MHVLLVSTAQRARTLLGFLKDAVQDGLVLVFLLCSAISKDYPLLSRTWWTYQLENEEPQNSPTFFVEIDYDDREAAEIYNKLKLKNAPTIAYLPASVKARRPALGTFIAEYRVVKSTITIVVDFAQRTFTNGSRK